LSNRIPLDIRPEFFNIYSKNKIKNMKNLKYINLFENFIVNSYGREVESISQIINFSLTDKSKSDFETHTWIKKWETDMETKPDDSDLEERIEKIGDMKYFLEDFEIYFYYEDINKKYPQTDRRFEIGPNQKIESWQSPNKEYKSNLEKILGLVKVENRHSSENYKKLDQSGHSGFINHTYGKPPYTETFLVGYGTIQTTEKVAYERFNYYCLVEISFLYNSDESIELYPFKILLKEEEPGQEEVIGVESGTWCKIERKEWESGLKPGDTDHRGFFKITSVEDYLGILRDDEKRGFVKKK
jgi:hypothetical protein